MRDESSISTESAIPRARGKRLVFRIRRFLGVSCLSWVPKTFILRSKSHPDAEFARQGSTANGFLLPT